MDTKTLQELGLSQNESKVYITLIEFGKLSAHNITSRSDVSHSKIYNILDSLIEKSLVKVIPEKTKQFIPTDPSQFLELIKKKEKSLERAKSLVKDMKKFYDTKEKNPVHLGYGRRAFYKIVDELKSGDEYTYAVKWSSEYNPKWVESARRKQKKGLIIKTLARFDKETEKNVDKWLKIHKNIKKFPNEGVAFSVTDDEEVMFVLLKSDVTMVIKDKPLAKMMKRLFEAAYDKAEDIK